jgi:hypothetical protein
MSDRAFTGLAIAALVLNAVYGLIALAFLVCAVGMGWIIFFS